MVEVEEIEEVKEEDVLQMWEVKEWVDEEKMEKIGGGGGDDDRGR